MTSTITLPSTGSQVRGFLHTTQPTKESPGLTGASGDLAPVASWLGIPLAHPERWRRATTPATWEGVRDCVEFGPACPQGLVPLESVWWDGQPAYTPRSNITQSEADCLTINVWRPDGYPVDGPPLPVFVFIHGGAFKTGSAGVFRYDMTELTRLSAAKGQPLIAVSFTYRLQCFGYLTHPDLADADGVCGNHGLHDQLLAMRWIQDNIAAFGGDPANVTVSGSSAGGLSIAALMTRNRKVAPGRLFRRGVFLSGAAGTMPFQVAGSTWPLYDELVKRFAPDAKTKEERVAALRAAPVDEVLALCLANPGVPARAVVETGPGAVFDVDPVEALQRGEYDPEVEEIIAGLVEHEGTFLGSGAKANTVAGHRAYIDGCPSKYRADLARIYPVPTADDPSIPISENKGLEMVGDAWILGPTAFTVDVLSRVPNVTTGKTLPSGFYFFKSMLPSITDGTGRGCFHTLETAYLCGATTLWKPDSEEQKVFKGFSQLVTKQDWSAWPKWGQQCKEIIVFGPGSEVSTVAYDAWDRKEAAELWKTAIAEGIKY